MNNPTCGYCDHGKVAHTNGLWSCIGYKCRCSRFQKQTAQTRQIRAMRSVLTVVIEMLQEWPTDDEKNRNYSRRFSYVSRKNPND